MVTPGNSKIPKEVLWAEVKGSQMETLRFKKELWTKAEINMYNNLNRHGLNKTKTIMSYVVRGEKRNGTNIRNGNST